MKNLFCADTHFGHCNVAKFRDNPNFETSEEHDDFIADNILSAGNRSDKLWILGDVCFDSECFGYVEMLAKYYSELNILVGNHDFENLKGPSVKDYLSLGNCNLHGFVHFNDAWLSHSPMHPKELRGRINIHGHVHLASIDDIRYFNVSMESEIVNYKPLSYDDIKKVEKELKSA